MPVPTDRNVQTTDMVSARNLSKNPKSLPSITSSRLDKQDSNFPSIKFFNTAVSFSGTMKVIFNSSWMLWIKVSKLPLCWPHLTLENKKWNITPFVKTLSKVVLIIVYKVNYYENYLVMCKCGQFMYAFCKWLKRRSHREATLKKLTTKWLAREKSFSTRGLCAVF